MKSRFNKKANQIFKKGGPKNLIFAVIFFVLCLGLLNKLTDYTRKITNLSYSAFLEKVEQGAVKKVIISGQDVYGEFKDGSKFESIIAETPKNWDILKAHNVEFSVSSTSNYTSFWHILMLISFLITPLAFWYFIRQAKGSNNSGAGGGLFGIGKSKAKLFMPSTIKENFNSVAGAAEAKEQLMDVVDFLRHPDKYKKLGAKITKGVLLVGEPGNGKTLLARAVAGEANCPFFSISGSDFIEVFVGVGAARVRDLFAQARKVAPCIIFIDEIDAVGRHRGSGLGGGHDEREQTLNQLLTEMDGFETLNEPVIVLAATNRADVLDKALLRPGRFDRRVDVPYPDLKSREQILNVHAKNIKIDPSVDLHKIAQGTPGFSGADLANLVNEAAIHASKQKKVSVDIVDFEEARDVMILGKELKTLSLTPEDLKITAYHEAGHALVRLMLPKESDPLYKVTIIPRGQALGVTHSLPEREKYTSTKEEMLAQVQSALGGRIAEEIVFNKMTTGAYSDFKAATEIVRRMVCHYGMSEKLGSAVYARSSYGELEYSEKTAELIDEEIRAILDLCYKKAFEIISANRDKLDKLANSLLEKETMYASEIYELLGIEPRKDFKLT